MLSFLPLAHSFDRILEELALCVGAHIGYWRVGGCLPAPMDEWLEAGAVGGSRVGRAAVRRGAAAPAAASAPHPVCASPCPSVPAACVAALPCLRLPSSSLLPHPSCLPAAPPCPGGQGNVKLLMDDVAALRPTLFIAVPRIIERVEDGGKRAADLPGAWLGGAHGVALGGQRAGSGGLAPWQDLPAEVFTSPHTPRSVALHLPPPPD